MAAGTHRSTRSTVTPETPDHPEWAELVAPPDAGPQRWIEQLNADPFNRMAAGVATRVVQNDQEPLMAAAWDQLDEVLAANRRIRWSQLFAASAIRMHERVEELTDARALRVTAPALARVLLSPNTTVAAAMKVSVVPPQVLDASFVRLTRYANRVGTTCTPTTTSVQLAVDAFRAGAATITPTRFIEARTVDHDALMALFGANPQLSEHVQVTNPGIDPNELLVKLGESRRLVGELAGRFDETPPVDVVPNPQGQPWIHARRGSAAARHLDDAVEYARGLLDNGVLQVDEHIADQLRVVDGPNVRRIFTPDAIQVINQAIGEHGGDEAPAQLNLAAQGFRLTFDEASARPWRDFAVETGVSVQRSRCAHPHRPAAVGDAHHDRVDRHVPDQRCVHQLRRPRPRARADRRRPLEVRHRRGRRATRDPRPRGARPRHRADGDRRTVTRARVREDARLRARRWMPCLGAPAS